MTQISANAPWKAHLGEVQASIWKEEDVLYAGEHGVEFL